MKNKRILTNIFKIFINILLLPIKLFLACTFINFGEIDKAEDIFSTKL